MINDPNPQSQGQRPRGLVFANGEQLSQVLEFQIDNNSFFQADTFSLTLALASQPENRDFAWWAVQEKVELEFYLGFPADTDNFTRSELTHFLTGYADDLEFDPVSDKMMFTGRDLTSRLIDYKRAISFVGELTASGVVEQIARERGLIPVVTPTQKPVGSYRQIMHNLITSDATYWDIVTRMAQIEQYQVYVKGRELHFEPRTAPDADPYVIRWQPPTDEHGHPVAKSTRLRFTRNLSIAKDLKVRVLSTDPKTKKSFEETAQRKRIYNKTTSKATKFSEPPQEYVYTLRNATPDEAQRYAQAMLEQLSRHEMNMQADMPGDVLLTAQNIIKVEGTGTAFDQTYYASSVTRRYSREGGFDMHVEGKNQTPNTPT